MPQFAVMSDPRYAMPGASVADQPDGPPLVRPSQVRTAIMLLGASYAVGWVSLVFADLRNVLLRTVSLTVSIALCVLFLSAIAKGKNWARITVAVFVAINLVVGVAVLLARVSGATTVGLSIRLLLQGPALTLLFSGRGASWFRPRAASRQTVG